MKLFDYILFSLTIVFFVIGVHQTFIYGLAQSYWIFMLCVALLLWYNIRKPDIRQYEKDQNKQTTHKKHNKKHKKR